MLKLYNRFATKTFSSPQDSKTNGTVLIFSVPGSISNGVACLFRFAWNSGFAKSCWPDELIGLYRSKANGPRTRLDYEHRLRAAIVTRVFSNILPSQSGYQNPTPDLIDSSSYILIGIPYISDEVLLNLFRQ